MVLPCLLQPRAPTPRPRLPSRSACASLTDDYCDCDDGSDEPGTSACPNSLFFCANKGYKSKDVFSSMVNDGVCDCCDGSDEWQTGACENDCIALGAANRAKAEERARLVAKGYEIATQWAARGEASRQSSQAELDALGQQLEGKRQELAAIDERKKAAEAVEEKCAAAHCPHFPPLPIASRARLAPQL